MKLYYLLPIIGIIVLVVTISFMLINRGVFEKEPIRVLDLDKNLESIKNCEIGEYVTGDGLAYHSLTIKYQSSENCKIELYISLEDASSMHICEIPKHEMQKFQGLKSFFKPSVNLMNYCKVESGGHIDPVIEVELSNQNNIDVEKNSPPIEITGTIDFHPFEAEFFFDPDADEMYKIEHTGKTKAFLVNSFIDPSKGKIPRDYDGKKVRITGVLVNDDPAYGKPEKTYDAIIIVQNIELLN